MRNTCTIARCIYRNLFDPEDWLFSAAQCRRSWVPDFNPALDGHGFIEGTGWHAGDFRAQHAGNRRLLDHLAIVAAVKIMQRAADDARILDQAQQVAPGALFARGRPEDAIVEPGRDQIVFQRALVFQILLRLAARNLIERRLGDVEITALDQRRASAGRRRSAAACGYARRRRRRRSSG